MTISKRLMLSTMILSSLFLLTACGEDDAATASAPAPAAAPAAAPAMESSSMSGMEKADGVVYQDEIYAGWPYN